MVRYVNARAVADAALYNDYADPPSPRAEMPIRPRLKRFRSTTLRNNVFPAAVAIQLTFVIVLILGHFNGSNNEMELTSLSIGESFASNREAASNATDEWLPEPRHGLPEPPECAEWKDVATDPRRLRLYYKHFASHDKTDWFLYVSIFNEAFNIAAKAKGRIPRYLDVGASWAKRWSNTYFFDRCYGWKGICVDPNVAYQDDIETKRTCQYLPKCFSDTRRAVLFAVGEAYGGIVKNGSETQFAGINLDKLVLQKPKHFSGTEKIICTPFKEEIPGRQHFDLMSLDVNGFELLVLKGIDWTKTTIDVIVVGTKSHKVGRLLRGKGYGQYQLLNNQLYVRRRSGLKINPKYLRWLRQLDDKTGIIPSSALTGSS